MDENNKEIKIENKLPNPNDFTKYKIDNYKDENDLKEIIILINDELSEPYSIYTYRYFLRTWPQLCFIV